MDNLKTWIEPLLESKGCTLYDLEWDRKMKPPVLRVMIDREDGGVDLDLCAACSEAISARLDETDEIPQEYMLEVCSPGAERELKTEKQIEAQVGKYVYIRMKEPVGGFNEVVAKLDACSPQELSLSFFIKGRPKKLKVERANIAQIMSAVKV